MEWFRPLIPVGGKQVAEIIGGEEWDVGYMYLYLN